MNTNELSEDYIKPTTSFWQDISLEKDIRDTLEPPYKYGYPARLSDGRYLVLPLRMLPDGQRALASLIANQASFHVIETLSQLMADLSAPLHADVIVGMPTLGLAFAPIVAQKLGHENYVPLGYSRKFWYRDDLSEDVQSITTPGQGKRIYIDPNVVPRLRGRRVILVDDAVSSGTTMVSVLKLIARLECEVVGIVVAMRQGVLWRDNLAAFDVNTPGRVHGALAGPIFSRAKDGWVPISGTHDGEPDL